MNLEDVRQSEMSLTKTQILHESTYVRYLELSGRSWLPGAGEGGNELLCNGFEISPVQNAKSSRDGYWGGSLKLECFYLNTRFMIGQFIWTLCASVSSNVNKASEIA